MILQQDVSFFCFTESGVDIIFTFADQLAVFFATPFIFEYFEAVQPVLDMAVY